MPDLLHALPHNDLGFLRIVAGLWGLELTAPEPAEAAAELAELLADADLIEEMLAALPAEARAVLTALASEGGRIPWPGFLRRFGEVREMGAGRRDRDKPHLNPRSAAETLYYRALLARAFFDTPSGPQEFAFIPDEFLLFVQQEDEELIEAVETEDKAPSGPATAETRTDPLGRAASPGEKAFITKASDRVLDDATTLLAALRMGVEPGRLSVPAEVLSALLIAAKLIEERGEKKDVSLIPGAVKAFLEAPRAAALSMLSDAWQASEAFDELRQLPDLILEGEVKNQPLVTREFLLNLLETIPPGLWWSLAALIRAVKAQYPDFQRPAGNFDVWLIRREGGESLRGFANWDAVDGALIRYLITGPLFWLGRAELGRADENGAVTAFRLAPVVPKGESGKMIVASNGQITVERLAPRAARYQVARFCDWEESKSDDYRYRVTVASLKAAAEQGLKASQLLTLLAKHSGGQVPPAFVKALKRWESQGTEARLEQLTVLRVSKPEVLAELRASPAGRFLAEQLGPTAVIVKGGAAPKVLAALAEMGLLAETAISEG